MIILNKGQEGMGHLKLQFFKWIVCVCVEGAWGVLGQLEAGMLQQQIVR